MEFVKKGLKPIIVLGLQIAAYILIAMSYSSENESMALLGDIFFLAAILIGSPYDDLVSYTLLIPFTSLMPASFFRLNICIVISILKLFFIGGKIKPIFIVSAFYMILSYVFLNAGYTYMTLLCLMVYCLAAVYILDFNRIDFKMLAMMLMISLTGALLLIITSSSDLSMYVEAQNEQVKLGEEVRDLGGAMGVSLYTCTGFACAFMLQRCERGAISIIASLAMIFFFGAGLFALSRTFFVSLAVSVVIGLLFGSFNLNGLKGNKIWPVLLMVIIIVGVLYYIINTYGDDIMVMFDKLDTLLEGGAGSRSKIWPSVIVYLLTHPITFLIGEGTNIYPSMESAKGYAFYGFGAHNLYLDILMSFGIIGFYLLCLLINTEVKKLKKLGYKNNKEKRIVVFPLALFFFCQMAQGSFRDTPSYIYPIVIIMISYGLLLRKQQKIK